MFARKPLSRYVGHGTCQIWNSSHTRTRDADAEAETTRAVHTMLNTVRHVRLPALRRKAFRYTTAATSTQPPTSTVNDSEIAHFSRLSSQWWDERGEFAFLHRMNPVRMRFILDKIREIELDEGTSASEESLLGGEGLGRRRRRSALEGLKVLDVGCGGGLLSEVHNFSRSPDYCHSERRVSFCRALHGRAPTRSGSTRRKRILASLPCTHRRTRLCARRKWDHLPIDESRRRTCSRKARGRSMMLCVPWRSSSTSTTLRRSWIRARS
ncbi:hypothetical protein HGRIS_004925 [Hohenbuehelia grisea]|uniref:Hexaprenyldihydroxybenzoate methyltransferase n=1 Tax=Hohenbuehelia grisea TaxID=104357 RepID=A0ABR3JDE6_9AGAR